MVNWKKTIVDPQASSVQIFGGDVINGLTQYHSNVDLAAGDPLGEVQIATKTTFGSGKLYLFDTGGDHSLQFSMPNFSENKTLSVPSTMATNDDLLMRTTVQTITGKNIDGLTNTFTNIGDSAIASHTSSKISINAKSQLNATIVYLTDTQTLASKTIDVDSNTIKHSTTNAAGDMLKGNGTSLQRFARGTTGQVLTSTGTDVAWQAPPSFLPDLASSGITWGLWAGGARDGTGTWSGAQVSGTPTGKQDATTNTKTTTEFVTGVATGNIAGFQGFPSTTAGFYTARNQNFHFKARFQVDALTSRRFAIGLASVASLPGATDAYLATAVPGFLFRFSDTTDTTIKLLRNDNAGSPVTVDTAVTLAVNTPVTLDIYADEPNTRMGWAINGGAITYYTTDIPANTTGLNYFIILETKSNAAQRLQLYYSYLTQDAV
jgi:hypothetical protein